MDYIVKWGWGQFHMFVMGAHWVPGFVWEDVKKSDGWLQWTSG